MFTTKYPAPAEGLHYINITKRGAAESAFAEEGWQVPTDLNLKAAMRRLSRESFMAMPRLAAHYTWLHRDDIHRVAHRLGFVRGESVHLVTPAEARKLVIAQFVSLSRDGYWDTEFDNMAIALLSRDLEADPNLLPWALDYRPVKGNDLHLMGHICVDLACFHDAFRSYRRALRSGWAPLRSDYDDDGDVIDAQDLRAPDLTAICDEAAQRLYDAEQQRFAA